MVTKNSTTITLTGEEQTVQFDRAYPYYWVQNLGDNDVLISMDGGIVEGADGVMTVPAGGSCGTMHGYTADRLYLLGSGRVQVMGTGSAFCPFKSAAKGGGGSGGGGVAVVDAIPENPDANTLYKYDDTFLGDVLMMYSGGHWRYSPLLLYPQKVFISPTEIYAAGHITDGTSTPASAISVVDLSEPVQVGNLLATQALKIYGKGLDSIVYGWTFVFDVPQDVSLGEKYLYIGVSAEGAAFDYAQVIVNGGDTLSYQPERDTFGKYAIPLNKVVNGANEITVRYVKDSGGVALDDCVYIYGVDYLYTM